MMQKVQFTLWPFRLLSLFVFFASVIGLNPVASALSVDWSGSYRFEYNELSSAYMTGIPQTSATTQGSDWGRKGYFLNHLNLTPKIIALDGVNVVSNLEVFPSSQYPGSQLGSDFGTGPASGTNPSGTINQSQTTGNSSIEVNQMYMTWNHEYGALAVGRMPLQFGLGITHNAGLGPFDHWIETHDLVAYKFLVGNLSISPMLGRAARSTNYAFGNEATEGILEVNYTNPETESTFAIMHEIRNSGQGANDSYKYFSPYDANSAPVTVGGLNTTLTSLFIARGWDSFKLRMEAGFQSGNTGTQYSSYCGQIGGTSGSGCTTQAQGNVISLSGYGIAFEFEFVNPESKWSKMIRTGIASGDNPGTQNFEGFSFSRNYDVAMLLFNQTLGQNNYDVLRTGLQRQRQPTSTNLSSIYSNDQSADEGALSNAIYISPKFDYAMSDHFKWINALTYASVQTNPSVTQSSVGTDLGWEYDTGFAYKPHKRFEWDNSIGFFLPGSVWKEGAANRDVNFVYGWQSKFGITF
jgi:hypothetical protein